MSTTATQYNKLYPKQGNLTGSPDQAYNLLAAKYFDHILGGIGAGTIATLGTVALSSYNLSYIYAPQVHTNLSRNFLARLHIPVFRNLFFGPKKWFLPGFLRISFFPCVFRRIFLQERGFGGGCRNS
jgi:hypothetical protein